MAAPTLPKIELHVHLEGVMSPALVSELARANDSVPDLPSFDWRRPGHRWSAPATWLVVMRQVGRACLRTPANYQRVLTAYLHELADQGAIYVEPSVTLSPATREGASPDDLLAALTWAMRDIKAARGLDAGLIVAIDYATPPHRAMELVLLAACFRDHGVVGIDLHGAPRRPMEEYREVFAAARNLGLGTRAHAGEFQGPRSVERAVAALGVQRVAHGVRAIEDPALMARLAGGEVALDLCPGGNVCLGLFPSMAAHPVRRLFDAGVPINVSTDDPFYFGTNLTAEYAGLAADHGFTDDELLAVTRCAARAAFAPASVRARLLAAIESSAGAVAVKAGS